MAIADRGTRREVGRLQHDVGRGPDLVGHPVRAGDRHGEAVGDPPFIAGRAQHREAIGVAQVVAEGHDGRRPEVREEPLEGLAFPARRARPQVDHKTAPVVREVVLRELVVHLGDGGLHGGARRDPVVGLADMERD